MLRILRQISRQSLRGDSLDDSLAQIHREIPSYACFPNLAWPIVLPKDPVRSKEIAYGKTGVQRTNLKSIESLLTEQVASEVVTSPPKLALLILTRGDVRSPDIWKEWVAPESDRISIFSHPKEPDKLKGGFLEGTDIAETFDTQWGEVSLVKASLALLRAALRDPELTHFALLSESCVPIQPLSRILLRLQHDGRPRFNSRDQERANPEFQSRMQQAPEIPNGCWRFHQQWWLLDRSAAVMATRRDYTSKFEQVFASDEGYFGTTLMLEGYPVDDLVDDRSITWTHWEKHAASPNEFRILPPERLREMLNSDCFFARKFPEETDIRSYGLHR